MLRRESRSSPTTGVLFLEKSIYNILMKRSKILVLLIAVLLILSLNFFSKEARSFFYAISSPVQKTFWGAGNGISDFFSGIFSGESLKRENEELKLENQKLLAEKAFLNKVTEENELLRQALGIGLAEEFQLGFASVVSKLADEAVLIDKGAEDGFSENMPVITAENVLVGKIDKVYKKFSRVALISQKENSFDVEISGKNIKGLIRGKGSSEIFLDLVSKDKELKKGDLVVSSSFGGTYPEGLLVGTVKEVINSDVQPFQQAEVSPFLDLRELKNVFIILSF